MDWRQAQRHGGLRTPTKETLQQAAEAWLAGVRANEIHARGGRVFKPSVVRSYERALRLRALPDLGHERFSELTLPDLQRFVNRLVGAGHNPSTIRNTINPLRAIYRHALSEGRVAVNPCLGLQLPAVESGRDRIASPAEAEELLTALPESDRGLWATAFFAGLRRGELRALRVNDVDVKAGIITVSHGWDDIEGEIEPKSKKGTREVPMPALLAEVLAAHIMRTGRRERDLIFGKTADVPFAPATVREVAIRAWEAENEKRAARNLPLLEPILLHSARHTFVSYMHAAGVSLEEIGDYVGHASSYMTDKYRHLLPSSIDEARRKMDALLAAARS